MQPIPRYTFRKRERLCRRLDIERLFGSGSHSLSSYPIRAVWRTADAEKPEAMVLISVSKRHFKHAVDRNRIKRLLREAYRKNKEVLNEALKRYNEQREGLETVHLALLWLSDNKASGQEVEKRVRNLLQRISESL